MSYMLALIPIAFILAGGAVWLARATREIFRKRNELAFADKQLAIYNLMYAMTKDAHENQKILEQAELSREIYKNVAAEYNHCVTKPTYRSLAKFLGFLPTAETKNR